MPEKEYPFQGAIERKIENFGLSYHQAIKEVDTDYRYFKEHLRLAQERQEDNSNKTQLSFISHIATLSTLTITVIGFTASNNLKQFNIIQKILFTLVLFSEILALYFTIDDYRKTINFYTKWAKLFKSVEDEVLEKFKTKELQFISDLAEIENSKIDTMQKETDPSVQRKMAFFCLAGLILAGVFYLNYFFHIKLAVEINLTFRKLIYSVVILLVILLVRKLRK